MARRQRQTAGGTASGRGARSAAGARRRRSSRSRTSPCRGTTRTRRRTRWTPLSAGSICTGLRIRGRHPRARRAAAHLRAGWPCLRAGGQEYRLRGGRWSDAAGGVEAGHSVPDGDWRGPQFANHRSAPARRRPTSASSRWTCGAARGTTARKGGAGLSILQAAMPRIARLIGRGGWRAWEPRRGRGSTPCPWIFCRAL
ncbi:hypothetical protein B0H15DRAFT_852761 [Mycena belliarum]|uniref:Uncharacterized protein n=1 Tax=Mycena belliarum TaxID=1033014 RepID=A0AAD6U108_9AGAR|nr:hypothetical protein B0H15DRAFT_852761 [Mycena belliae]